MTQRKRNAEGIRVRHSRSCRSQGGAACNCEPAYEAWVWSPADKKKIYKTFTGKGAKSAASNWRSDAKKPVREGLMRAPTQITLREAWKHWVTQAEAGLILTRSEGHYKPSAIRSYQESMALHVLEDYGALRISAITKPHLQELVRSLQKKGKAASTIRNTLMPLRALYRYEIDEGRIAGNPTSKLSIPKVKKQPKRITSREEATELITALPEDDRALWATAFYAGLRLGELQALRDENVDLAEGVIRVEQSWDKKAGPVDPKSDAGTRKVPIVGALRPHLAAHRLRRGKSGGLFFGDDSGPFSQSGARVRSLRVWNEAKLTPIGFHEARHTYASIAIAAGVNAKTISTYMGHSSIKVTFDLYGHLMPGNEAESVERMDKYLTGAQSGGKATQTAQ